MTVESSRGDCTDAALCDPALLPVDAGAGTPERRTWGDVRGADGVDRTATGRVLAGAGGSRGVPMPVVGPVRGAGLDGDAVDGRGAGGAGGGVRGVATAVGCACVATGIGCVRVGELAGGVLAAGADVFVTTLVIGATAEVTALRVVVTGAVAGGLGRRWVAEAVAVVTTLVMGAVACAACVVALATAGTTCATAVTGFVAVLATALVTAVGAVAVAVLETALVTAVGAVAVAVLTALVAVAVAVLTVLVTGAGGAAGAAGSVVLAGAVAVVTVFVTVVAGATAADVTLVATPPTAGALEPPEVSCAAGLGSAATARFGAAATIASSSNIAAAYHRNRVTRSATSARCFPNCEKTYLNISPFRSGAASGVVARGPAPALAIGLAAL